MLTKTARECRSTQASSNFSKLHQVLSSECVLVTDVWNGKADRPSWQSRFMVVLYSETVIIDLVDEPRAKSAIKVHIHNRVWDLPVSTGAKTHIYKVLTEADIPFYIGGVLL